MRTHVHFRKANVHPKPAFAFRRSAGFTLIELMIAMTVFLVIGAAAMSLFKQHASLFNDQQYQIGLNVSLRNALSQMEADVVNAGTGWYNAANISSWPIGITIVNNIAGGAACHLAGSSTYNAPCFDHTEHHRPRPHHAPGPGLRGARHPGLRHTRPDYQRHDDHRSCGSRPPLRSLISGFTSGSQVVFIHVGTSGTLMTTAILSANAAAAGANVNLTYGATNANGTNNAAPANDRLNLTLTANVDPALIPTTLTDSFCSGTDWVVKVAPIQLLRRYRLSIPLVPTLVRTENGIETPSPAKSLDSKSAPPPWS